jgi:hypothetical protein
MKPSIPWKWIGVAVVLALAIVVHQRFGRNREPKGLGRILPQLKAGSVTTVQVRPAQQLELRAQKDAEGWRLLEPLAYPARSAAIEGLLSALERLVPATVISGPERRTRAKADEEDGFDPPQATVIIQQGGYRAEIQFGGKTAPGDQVFVQVIGIDSVFVVDAGILKLLPASASDWRNTTLINVEALTFDRLTLTTGPKTIEVQRDSSNGRWRMTSPMEARANNSRIGELLNQLKSLQVEEFVSDDPRADFEAAGLQPPQAQLTLAQGTNTVAVLQFGRSPTNNAERVYARLQGQDTLVAIAKESPAAWQAASVFDFRDPHMVTIAEAVDSIEISGPEEFSVRLDTNGNWRITPHELPADAELVREALATLNSLKIVEFTKDAVIPQKLPEYGLGESAKRYRIWTSTTNDSGLATNKLVAELSFGTNDTEKSYARRSDETSVYGIGLAEFRRLPWKSLQLRERRLWAPSEDIAGVKIMQGPKSRQMLRKGAHEWSLAAGSQGLIDSVALEETVRMLANVSAVSWAGRGEESRARCGFSTNNLQVAIDFKNGEKRTVEFAQGPGATLIYGCAVLGGEPWVFEFPSSLYAYVQTYLTIPDADR